MSIRVIFVNLSRVPVIFTFFHFSSLFTVLCDSLPSFSQTDDLCIDWHRFTDHLFLTEKTFSALLRKYPRIKASMPWIRVAWREVGHRSPSMEQSLYTLWSHMVATTWHMDIFVVIDRYIYMIHAAVILPPSWVRCDMYDLWLRSSDVAVCTQVFGLWSGSGLEGCFDCVVGTWGFQSVMSEEIFSSIMEMKRVECI